MGKCVNGGGGGGAGGYADQVVFIVNGTLFSMSVSSWASEELRWSCL